MFDRCCSQNQRTKCVTAGIEVKGLSQRFLGIEIRAMSPGSTYAKSSYGARSPVYECCQGFYKGSLIKSFPTQSVLSSYIVESSVFILGFVVML